MSELDHLISMLNRAQIKHEVDSETYPNRIIVRTFEYSLAYRKDKITAIFDFTSLGELVSIS